MGVRRYGGRSGVPISRTRGAIEELLQGWGVKKFAFLDDYDAKRVEIQFVWESDNADMYAARFGIDLTLNHKLTKPQQEAELRGRFRTLFYWLRAALDAVDAGVISAEALFLPWLVGADGQTVSEVLLPRLREIHSGNLGKMLGAGS